MKIFQIRRVSGAKEYLIFGFKVFRRSRRNRNIVVSGERNVVSGVPGNCQVSVYGTDNQVIFDPSNWDFAGRISLGSPNSPVSHCSVTVGVDVRSNGTDIVVFDNGSEVSIGSGSRLAFGTRIYCSDTHAILSEDGKVVNRGRFVRIGRHCWIGLDALILKNTVIPDGSIVGAAAVVTKQRGMDNLPAGCLFAGNPATVVRTGVHWDVARPNDLP